MARSAPCSPAASARRASIGRSASLDVRVYDSAMQKHRSHRVLALLAAAGMIACGNTTATDAGPLTCASPGMPTSGPADTHCGTTVQPVHQSSCFGSTDDAGPEPDAGLGDVDAGAVDTCDYGDTLFGMEGDDDDCKYHVRWTSTSICEGASGVTFTVVATSKADGTPVTGAEIHAETFLSAPAGASCDDALASGHTGPGSEVRLTESTTTPGTYVGNVAFDRAGQWTIRFHLFEMCDDAPEDSPHGHEAFRLTVP